MGDSVEGCTMCGWRGSYEELLAKGGHDQCPECDRPGTMTTYGPAELREGESA